MMNDNNMRTENQLENYRKIIYFVEIHVSIEQLLRLPHTEAKLMFSSGLAMDITCHLGVEGCSGDDWGLRVHEFNAKLICT